MIKFGVGQPVTRLEDARLLKGKGRYQDDTNLPGQLHAVFLRSPHAHAKIRSIRTSTAAAAPGVHAVYTGADYAADGLAMPKAAMPRKKADGSPMFAPQRPALVVDRARYVGDPVAMIIADTLGQAKDAAELVEVDYEALPSVTSTADAALPDAPRVWDENPDNISHTYERGDKAKTEAAFASARHIVRRRYVISRVHAQYMEPRGAIGTYDTGEDRYTLYADVNYPHRVRNMLANMVFKVPESKVRVVCHDVGGGFGSKGWQYVEHRLTLWAAKKLGHPVKWSCERSEVILADEHGRDNIGEIELAFDDDAKILALRLHMLASIGAYIASDRQLLTPFGMIGTVVGVYDIPAAYVSIDAVLSNTSPTATGSSSMAKCVMVCSTLSSSTLKCSFSSPVTGRLKGSHTVTGTSTRLVSLRMLACGLRESATVPSLGRGWVWVCGCTCPRTSSTVSSSAKTNPGASDR